MSRDRFRIVTLAFAALIAAELAMGGRPAHAQEVPTHPLEMMTWQPTWYLLFDRFEYAPRAGERPIALEMSSWYGGAVHRVWLRGELDQSTRDRDGDGEAELLYGRLVDPFWDAVVGARVDGGWPRASSMRVHGAIGIVGLAPYRFELSPMLYVSTEGDIAARLEASYQLLLTQRLIAEPEFEINAGLQAVPEAGLDRGLQDYEAGIRIRYEIRREFGPYIGWSWARRLGGTADIARVAGEAHRESSFVIGVRMWR